jgi:urease alpha subunit
MANVHPFLIIDSSIEVITEEKLIVTAGAIDVHVHYVCPQQVEALAAGTTTTVGGGTGPTGSARTSHEVSPRFRIPSTDRFNYASLDVLSPAHSSLYRLSCKRL